MLTDLTDLDKVIRDKVGQLTLGCKHTFDALNYLSAEAVSVNLLKQNSPFVLFDPIILHSMRAGPSIVSPTRHFGVLHLEYYTKEQNKIKDLDFLENLAKEFAEKTLNGVRFKVFTPSTPIVYNGFTSLAGTVDFNFELYRGV